ncbi:Mobile element protein [Ligilactobacillus acidipiscis]|uniref:Mobile element protein n=1 Tax=Ligilactobacillus acidipiscis TaxID=89059 RepID=A0A1K1KW56_9LACO|nr:Mobile element protein [Ligilactobacillus acidipiscis]
MRFSSRIFIVGASLLNRVGDSSHYRPPTPPYVRNRIRRFNNLSFTLY